MWQQTEELNLILVSGSLRPGDHLVDQEDDGPQTTEEDDGDEDIPGNFQLVSLGSSGDGQADDHHQQQLGRGGL